MSISVAVVTAPSPARESPERRDAGRREGLPWPCQGAKRAARLPPPPAINRDLMDARPAGGNPQGKRGRGGARAGDERGGGRGKEGSGPRGKTAPILILILGNSSRRKKDFKNLKKWLSYAEKLDTGTVKSLGKWV